MKKRVLSLLLVLVMLLGLLPTTALAATPMGDERPEIPMGDEHLSLPEFPEGQPDSSASEDADADGQPISVEDELPEVPEDEIPASLFATTGQITGAGNLTITLDTGSAHAHHGGDWNDGFKPYEGESRLASYDNGTVEVRYGNQIYTKERDKFKNADYLWMPFTLSADVPAHSAITYNFTIILWHKRNSKGGVHYWVELLDNQNSRQGLNTGNNGTPSSGSLGRLRHESKDGGNKTFDWSVTFENYDGSSTKTIQRKMAYYVGASKSTSALTSYHHQVESSITFGLKNSSVRKRITYNNNGGSGSTLAQVFSNRYIQLAPAPTRTGYDFQGWQDSFDGRLYVGNGEFSEARGAAMTAQWRAKSLNVTFDPNGGTVSQSQKSVTYGETYGTLPTPTRTGYQFEGWTSGPTGGQVYYAHTRVNETENHTLYAYWTQNRYAIKFDGNGLSYGATYTARGGNALGTLPAPTRTGYDLDGWYTAKTGGTKVESTTVPTADATYYAHWTPKTVAVTLNANGGTVTDSSKSVTYNATYGDLPTPTRPGYTFTGWYTASSGGSKVESSTKVQSANAHTLYARWSRNTYTVTFNANIGSAVASRTVNAGDALGTLPTSTKAGYTLTGWFSGDTQVTKDTVPTGDVTYTAKWTANQYTVTFDPNGGKVSQTSMTVTYGLTYGTLPTPTRTGYTFDGWFNAPTNGGKVESNDVVTNAADHTLYARWTANTYTVTVNGTDKSVTADQTYGDILPADPTKTGYTFQYWEDEKGNRIVPSASIDPERLPTAISPVWTANTYTVTFDVNGGNTLSDSDKTKTVTYGQPYGTLPVPTHPEGKVFRAWYDASSGGNFRDASSLVTKDADHTLYARWETDHTHRLGAADFGDKKFSALGQTADAGNSVTAASDVLGTTISASKNCFLATDVEVAGVTSIPSGVTLNLCLNGHKLTHSGTAGSIFVVEDGGKLNICDCNGSHGSHQFTSPVTNSAVSVPGGLITGGNIGSGDSGSGGAVLVKSGGTFSLYSGFIGGNDITSGGSGQTEDDGFGAVRVEGTFHMYGGSICHNKYGCGGGLNICGGEFYLHGGSISYNYASHDDGGAICLDGGTVNIEGGSITDNRAKEGGGGIHVYSGAVNLSGSPVIQNNTTKTGGTNYNIRLDGSAKLTVNEGFSSAKAIGVSSTTAPTLDAPVAVGTAGSGAYARYFLADAAGQEVVDDNGVLSLKLHSHPVCGDGCSDHDGHTDVEYTALTQAMVDRLYNSTLSAGNYFLAEDITTPRTFSVQQGATVSLCLNGHTLETTRDSNGSNVITVSCSSSDSHSALNVCDCQGTGKVRAATCSGYYVSYNSSVNLYGGGLESRGTAASVLNDASLTVDGASLTSTESSGVYLNGTAKLLLKNGSITATADGKYGVNMSATGVSVQISGGSVSGGAEGAVYVKEASTLTLSGSPTIHATGDHDIYLNKSQAKIAAGDDLAGTYRLKMGYSATESFSPTITTASGRDHSAHFVLPGGSDYESLGLRDVENGDGTHTLRLYKKHLHDGVEYEYTPLTAGTTLTDGGHYLLTADVTWEPTVPVGATVDLCLNGHSAAKLHANGTLNLWDCTGNGSVKEIVSAASSKSATVHYYSGLINYVAIGNAVRLHRWPTLTGDNPRFWFGQPGYLHIDAALDKPETPLRFYLGNDSNSHNLTDFKAARKIAITTGWSEFMGDADPADFFTPGPNVTAKVVVEDGEAVLRYLQVNVGGTVCYPAYDAADGYTPGTLTADDLAEPETRVGYLWDGWYTAEEGGDKVTADTVFTDDATLYPRWTPCDHKANTTKPTVVPATCVTAGSETYTCSVCGLEVVAELKALEHDFETDTDWYKDVDNGTHYHKCSHCDQRQDEAEHTWDDGAVTTEPSAGAAGVMTFTCEICGATTTEAIPALATHSVTYTVDDYTNEPAPTQESVVKGTVLTLPDGLTRTGYTLSGWVLLDEEGVPGAEALSGEFTMPDRDVTFQVRWERIPNFALQPGDTLVLPDGTVIQNNTGGTVTIDQNGDGEAETTITLPDGGSVTIQEGQDGGKDKVTVPPGAKVETTPGDGGQGPVITIGEGEGKVDPSGKVDAPVGTTITDKDGNTITITEGSGGTVDPEGVVTFPDGEGGKVTVTDKEGNETEVTVPGGGEGLDVTPGGVPIINDPGGTLTIPDGQGGFTTVTVPEDGEEGAELDDAGNLTLPGGSTITKTDGEGNETEVTVPDGGGTVTPGGKLDQDKPVGIFKPTDIDDEHIKGAIAVTADADRLEWRRAGDEDWTSVVPDGSTDTTATLDELEVGDYEFRYKETETHAASEATVVQVRTKNENAKRLDLAEGITHGTVTKRRDWVNPGDTVNLTVKAEKYYRLTALTAGYEGGEDITPDKDPDNSAHYTFTMPDGDVTVSATFGLIVYTIDYQYAGVADGSFTAQSASVTLAQPTREGYTFNGWSFTPGGEVIENVTVAGLLERVRGSTVLLYPRWTSTAPSHSHVWAAAWETSETHHWHLCTADGCDIADYAACGEAGAAYGKHVYDDDRDATCNTCGYERTITPPQPDTFTVTFDVQGGQSAPAAQSVAKGKLVVKPATPVREGYEFGGWVTEANGSVLWKFNTDAVSADMTLYATWTAKSAGSVVTPGSPVDIPGGGTVTKDPDTGDVTITPPADDPSGTATVITPPTEGGGDDVTVDPGTGEVTVPSGSTVDPGNGVKVELPDGGKVDGQGNITLPDGGEAVTVPDGEGGSATITAPDGGGAIKPTGDGKLEIPGGSTVTVPDGNGGQTGLTVPDQGGKVDPDGTVTVPGGSTVTIPDGKGGKTEVTVPTGNEADITPTGDGKLEVPGGSTVTKPDGTTTTVPSGGGLIDPATGDVTPVKQPTSGGSSPSSNKPSVSAPGKGGKVEADRNGNVTIIPDKGYEIDTITVNGKEVTVPADGKLTGLKRTDKVVVTFKEVPAVTVEQFTDVKSTDWFYDSVKAVVDQGLMNGTGEATFAPGLTTSRAMIATVLWRLAGEPDTKAELTYPDCAKDSWYAKAVAWASERGVVKGYGAGGFGPDDPITREQLAAMLYRYAGSPKTDGALDGFSDAGQAGSWATDALRWAVEQGILQGKGDGILDPAGQATRAEAAAMLARYSKNEK